ncbi:MAG: CoA transferase [Chloroflexi bacterium]|nr:CoA transferase [Chloroflexota bacterium]
MKSPSPDLSHQGRGTAESPSPGLSHQGRGTPTILGGYRVLDLTDHKGYLCGKVLADLGADVIKVERPGGDPGRRLGPFYHNIPHPEKSLFWFAYNNNKRSITLNLETATGQDIFKRLAAKADFLVESFHPGYLDGLGLGYAALSRLNRRLVFTSITPFGQAGPYHDFKASDLIVMAMGGHMYLTGDADRRPLRIGFPQAFLHGAAEAAAGTMVAHYYRETTGEGQHVDASAQASMCWTLMNAFMFWDLVRVKTMRSGIYRGWAGPSAARQIVVWPTRDGYVAFAIYGGLIGSSTNKALVAWLDEEALATPFLKDVDWDNFNVANITQAQFDDFAAAFGELCRRHSNKELMRSARERGMMFYEVATVKNIVEDEQLAVRGFWRRLEHPELGAAISYPGPMAALSETPLVLDRRPPLIGEHNEEIYVRELGFSKAEFISLRSAGII